MTIHVIIKSMPTRYYNFAEGEYYHVYNRGNSKQKIYKDASDYNRFLSLLYLSNNKEAFTFREVLKLSSNPFLFERGGQLVHIGAYCLMPNHFHLLITPNEKEGVSIFMNRLGTSYAMYFNKKYERTGRLFESSFKSKYSESDRYLKYLYSYIHLNPVRSNPNRNTLKANDLTRLCKYSSLPFYLGDYRREDTILSPQYFPEYFITPKSHLYELYEWLDYQD